MHPSHHQQHSAHPQSRAAQWRLWFQNRFDAIEFGDLVSSQRVSGMGAVSRGWYRRNRAPDSSSNCQTVATVGRVSGAGVRRNHRVFRVLERLN